MNTNPAENSTFTTSETAATSNPAAQFLKRSVKTSTQENKFSVRTFAIFIGSIVGFAWLVSFILQWGNTGFNTAAVAEGIDGTPWADYVEGQQAGAIIGTPTPMTVTASLFTDTAAVAVSVAPTIAYVEVYEIVTVTVPGPTEYIFEVEYVPVTEIVTRFITVTAPVTTYISVNQASAQSLAIGSLRICADVHGGKQLFIGGVGVAGGECRDFATISEGQTEVTVQVNR